jgi:hypothetical protein
MSPRKLNSIRLDCDRCGYDRAFLMLDMSDLDVDEIPTYTVCVNCKKRGPNHTDSALSSIATERVQRAPSTTSPDRPDGASSPATPSTTASGNSNAFGPTRSETP